MALYYSTFISGLLKPVREALQQSLPHARIHLELDGLLLYESASQTRELQALPFVSNTFAVVKTFPQNTGRSLAEMAKLVTKDRSLRVAMPRVAGKRVGTFRVVTSLANQLVSISPAIMNDLEERIEQDAGARSNRAKPDTELWLLQRSEGYGFFSVRLSQHRSIDKALEKGELRPDLAYLLCHMSKPVAGELFLDPFCGSGSIPIQRTRFATGLIFASDADCDKTTRLKSRVRDNRLNKKIVVRCEDALNLDRYEDGSIHAIVTDPPWGHFQQLKLPLRDFYERMVKEFVRILRCRGKLIVLTGEPEIFLACLPERALLLELSGRFDILVSGKKATVFSLVKH